MAVVLGLALSCFFAVTSALYSSSDDVVELTPSNFNNLVINSNDLWLVEFYAPWCGHCKNLAPEWKKAASALKGIVNVGAVDMDQHQSLGAPYGIQGFPTIKIFGRSKSSPENYQGGRTASAIVDAAMSELKQIVNSRLSGKSSSKGGSGGGGSKKQGDAKDIVELTDSNFEAEVLKTEEMVLVEFFAPWCGHCKSLAPHWAQAATELKGKVKVAALDATVHTVMSSRYGVQGFPTIKMFPAGKKQGDVVDYDGGRTASDIVNWALDKLAENIVAAEVTELTSNQVVKDACEERQICVVSILPHILDCQSQCRNQYIKVLQDMSEKYKKRMWGYVWAEAGAQPKLEEVLGIGGFGYPAMVAVNVRKSIYSPLRGPFSETGINEHLRTVAVGRGMTVPIDGGKLPNIVDAQPWDGKDGQLPEEEDIDLSDVELDDLDDDKKDEL